MIVSLAGGLHCNTLLSMGVGPLAYVLFPLGFETERVSHSVVIENALEPFALSLIGYLAVFGVSFHSKSRVDVFAVVMRLRHIPYIQIYVIFIFGLIGVIAVGLQLNASGVGTIFNVFYLLVFPIVSLAVIQTGNKTLPGLIAFLIIVGGIGYYSLTSYWRSLSLIYAISILIGVGMRFRIKLKVAVLLAVTGVSWYVFLFPFLQLKKNNTPSDLSEIATTFIESQKVPITDRIPDAFAFLGLRTNGAREIGYIETGLRNGVIDLRRGESYLETLLQLIPRTVWPSKPSYNAAMNYELPRAIGLLGSDDYDTSSGVGLWAEGVWNFGPYFLIFYVPALFWIFELIDRKIWSAKLDLFFKWLLGSCLFYLSLQVLNLVNFVTMLLWTIIILLIYSWVDRLLFSQLARGDVRRPIKPRSV
jgi:hypothetical protein